MGNSWWTEAEISKGSPFNHDAVAACMASADAFSKKNNVSLRLADVDIYHNDDKKMLRLTFVVT